MYLMSVLHAMAGRYLIHGIMGFEIYCIHKLYSEVVVI